MSDNPEWQLDPQTDQQASEGSPRRSTASLTRTMADLLFLPDAERSLMNWLVRQQQATLSEIAVYLNQPEPIVQTLLDELMTQGFIQEVEHSDSCHYQPKLVSRKGRGVPTNIWDALG